MWVRTRPTGREWSTLSDIGLLKKLVATNDSKMILLVMDGLGGLPHPGTGCTELETAHTPNMDGLARRSACGLIHPIAPGITPGSGPAHLSLFGYDPVKYNIGRGVLAACGIGFPLERRDLAFRINFATMEDGVITDRRAGRIATEECERLCKVLDSITLDGVEVMVRAVMQHRGVVIIRGDDLHPELTDSDPQQVGKKPLPVEAKTDEARRTAGIVNEFIARAREALKDEHPANMILARGFDKLPALDTLSEAYGIKAAVIASYPMYKGLGSIVGMDVIETGKEISEEFGTLKDIYSDYDFVFLHIKPTDSLGEDGDFAGKVGVIEEVDRFIPGVLDLKPEVLVITGDHSTPAILQSHSWHPVPLLLYSPWERQDSWLTAFGESQCACGSLGVFPAWSLMALMLAAAKRLQKFGA